MAITLSERFQDIETTDAEANSDDGAVKFYVVKTTSSELEPAVRAYCDANIATAYEGLVRSRVLYRRVADDVWDVTAEYESAASPGAVTKLAVDETRWSVRTGGGGSAKRTYSDSLVSETTDVSDWDFSGTDAEKVLGITKTADGYEVEGIDYQLGSVEVVVETVKSAATVSGGYLVTLAQHAKNKAVNTDAWNGFAAGTLQVTGFQATERGGSSPSWDISMTFSVSPNLTSIDVGNGLTVPSKKGHEVLDIMYGHRKVNDLPLSVPIRAAVHKIYPEISFSATFGV